MSRQKLDRTDRAILAALQQDGSLTNVALAARVGLSPPPALRRVRALEAAGVIRGYHADVEPQALGYGVTVFAQVGLENQSEADLSAFEAMVAGWPMVRECWMLAGETDYLLKIVAETWEAYQTFLTTKLTAGPNVAHVKSALGVREAKRLPGPPLEG